LRTYRASVTFGIDGRDSPVFPSNGFAADAAYEWVTGDVRLSRLRGRASLHRALDGEGRHLLAVSVQAAALWPFGATEGTGVPRFERLFLGTENDLRGFPIRGVGPRTEDVVVGGDRLVQASTEYLMELRSRLRLVGFFDFGNVYASDFDGVELPALRYDAGAEAQVLAPILELPVRAGYGFNLDPLLDEPRGRFFVTFALRF
jgi:outer membrane protein assembly factor BamA